jgi:DivIVA domain-containing protein
VLRGYNREQVDDLVAKVEGTLGRAPLKGDPMTLKRFQWVKFDSAARGYDPFEVDGAMRRYRRELAALEGIELPAEPEQPNVALSALFGDASDLDEGPGTDRDRYDTLVGHARSVHEFATRFRGYDRRQVDEFMARVFVTLGKPGPDGKPLESEHVLQPLSRGQLNSVQFDLVFGGYDRRQVDDAISHYLRELLDRKS